MTLVAHWPLQENYGDTAYDASGNGHDGVLNGGITQGVNGISTSSAYKFDGTDDYIDTGFVWSGFSSYTLAGWVYVTEHPSDYRSVMGNDVNSTGVTLQMKNASNNSVSQLGHWDGSGTFVQVEGPTVPLNEWVHFAGTWDGSNIQFYFNGMSQGSVAVSTITHETSSNVAIGDRSVNNRTNPWPGNLADIRIYERSLTAGEIQTLYNATLGGSLQVNK